MEMEHAVCRSKLVKSRGRSANPAPTSGATLASDRYMRFRNRADAGRQLASLLHPRARDVPVIVGVVRGGVPVAAEIARALSSPLEICVVRSLLTRTEPRLSIGAVAERGAMYLDPARAAKLSIGDEEVERLVAEQVAEVDRLAVVLRDGPPLDLRDRDVILVDDGIVTGSTVRAAIRSLRRVARSVELAVPVGATAVIERLRPFVDHLYCLVSEPSLTAIGARYDSFEAVSEAEVASLLAATPRVARRRDEGNLRIIAG